LRKYKRIVNNPYNEISNNSYNQIIKKRNIKNLENYEKNLMESERKTWKNVKYEGDKYFNSLKYRLKKHDYDNFWGSIKGFVNDTYNQIINNSYNQIINNAYNQINNNPYYNISNNTYNQILNNLYNKILKTNKINISKKRDIKNLQYR
jgi:hypothetical protein